MTSTMCYLPLSMKKIKNQSIYIIEHKCYGGVGISYNGGIIGDIIRGVVLLCHLPGGQINCSIPTTKTVPRLLLPAPRRWGYPPSDNPTDYDGCAHDDESDDGGDNEGVCITFCVLDALGYWALLSHPPPPHPSELRTRPRRRNDTDGQRITTPPPPPYPLPVSLTVTAKLNASTGSTTRSTPPTPAPLTWGCSGRFIPAEEGRLAALTSCGRSCHTRHKW